MAEWIYFFNPALLRVDSVSFSNSVFDFQKQVNAIDNTTGHIDSILVSSIVSEHSGNFLIAEVFFTALSEGTNVLHLSPSTFDAPWLNSNGDALSPTYLDGTVQVVPIPFALGLFLSGLGVLGGIGFRRPHSKLNKQ